MCSLCVPRSLPTTVQGRSSSWANLITLCLASEGRLWKSRQMINPSLSSPRRAGSNSCRASFRNLQTNDQWRTSEKSFELRAPSRRACAIGRGFDVSHLRALADRRAASRRLINSLRNFVVTSVTPMLTSFELRQGGILSQLQDARITLRRHKG